MTMPLSGKTCVVTGASSGIGRAIALALNGVGARVYAIGRQSGELAALSDHARGVGSGEIIPVVADLENDLDLGTLASRVPGDGRGLDILVHAAGAITVGAFGSLTVSDLDRQYRVNLRAPFEVTRTLLPALRQARGQVVFINSSAALHVGATNVSYAATKAGLRALADGVRAEVNSDGVRVLTVYAGRTATPMQEDVHEREGRTYRDELLLRPEEVAEVVVSSLLLPRTGEVTEVSIRPMSKLPEVEAP
jgi:NADP-dependent 3-hydroxy acid dehydrogenase YdfG